MNLATFAELQPEQISASQCVELSRDLATVSMPVEFKQDIQFLLSSIIASGGHSAEDVNALTKLIDSI